MTGDPRRREAGAGPSGGVPPRSARLEQDFDDGSLYALRSAVAAYAAAAGLPPGRVYDVVAAAHEMAANAVRHGAGHGRLRVWRVDHTLLCEISDDGVPPSDDTPAGDQHRDAQPDEPDGSGQNVAAHWRTEAGHGLSLVRQVADQASLTSGPDGTVATVSFALGTSGPPFGLERRSLDDCTVLAVTGLLGLGSAGPFTETIEVLLAAGTDLRLILDLPGLAGWDSSGLAALITAQRRIIASPPARMVLAGLPGHLSRHLADTGLAGEFILADSAEDAARLLS